MPDVAMPRLSDSMEEGTILKWLKADGDEVRRGDELVEIETDKANMTYEADQEGVLEIVAQEGDTLPVGEVIARIGERARAAAAAPADGARDQGAATGAEPAGGGGTGDRAAAPPPAPPPAGQPLTPASQGEETPGRRPDEAAEAPRAQRAEAPTAEAPQAEPAEAPQAEPAEAGPAQPAADTPGPGAATPEPEADAAEPEADAAEPEAERATAPAARNGDEGADGRIKASPIARRMASELGLALETLSGSGPGGRIVKSDVETAARAREGAPAPEPEEGRAPPAPAAPPAEPPVAEPARATVADTGTAKGTVEHQELTRLQQTVARRMAESKATAPDFVLDVEVDMGEAVELRRRLKELAGEDGRPASFNDFVVKASALALREFPRANGAYRDGRFELYSRVNVGVAVAGQDALVVPTIFDADRKSLGQIAEESRALAERVRAGTITPPELSGGTFTVSNLGMYGMRRIVPVINPPQAAILGVGEMVERPVVRDGDIVARPVMALTLACDHRILYGADAARFLGRVRELLEQPLRLAL